MDYILQYNFQYFKYTAKQNVELVFRINSKKKIFFPNKVS